MCVLRALDNLRRVTLERRTDSMTHASPRHPTPFSARAHNIHGSVIDSTISLLQQQPHGVIPLAMGCPGPEAIPINVLRNIATEVMADPTVGVLNYGPTEGEKSLRSALVEFLSREGKNLDPGSIVVTSGGMQGLDLVCKLFIDPGDLVVVESPTYTNGTATIQSYEGGILEVPVDDHGLIVEAIPEFVQRSGRKPKLFYIIPNSQNPYGATLSLSRRERLLELAYSYGSLILEDDPYRMLNFSGELLPSLWEMDNSHRQVVAVHTFSKILAPGLRVGWVLGPEIVVKRMVAAKQAMDTCTNVPGQRLVAEFLSRGLMPDHLGQLRSLYREKKVAMQAALSDCFRGVLNSTWTDPTGGFFLWLTLPADVDASRLFRVAIQEGVAFIPGSAFSVSGSFKNALRLCFAHPRLPEIQEGVRRLRAAFDVLSVQSKDAVSQ